MTGRASTMSRESERDQNETEFTPLLRGLFREKNVLGIAFVDSEGECVDYCGALAPYDLKVTGAHMWMVMADVHGRSGRLGSGDIYGLSIEGGERGFIVRRVSDEYALVLVFEGATLPQHLDDRISLVVDRLRRIAALGTPEWDPISQSLEVDLREATGWAYAPVAFQIGEQRIEVAAVLGRWTLDRGGAVVCFRVRTRDGEELTLEHDLEADRWSRKVERLGDE